MKCLFEPLRYGVRVCALILATSMVGGSLFAQEFNAQDATTYSTCSGTFHDSGGSALPYGNGETLVTTLCPTGGPASGPSTSVLFSEWQLAAGPGDTLKIFEGVTAVGIPILVAGASDVLVGQSFTSTGISGCLTFQWQSNASGTAAGWTALITTGPDAGLDGSLSVCSSDDPQSLFDSLGGTPDIGGAWEDPNGDPHPGLYDPAGDPAGEYIYTVQGDAPCPAVSASVVVSRTVARDAGSSASITVCGSGLPFLMRSRLGGTPEPGGTWQGPLGQPHPASFDPGSDPAGTYTYTLVGVAPCPDASASLDIAVQAAPSAGLDASIAFCDTDDPQDLFDVLAGVPQAGGSWEGPDGPHSGSFDPGQDTPGDYVYTVAGVPPCAAVSATVSVTVNVQPDAGNSATTVVCDNDGAFLLFGLLGGDPDAGGAWTGPGGNPVAGTYTPGSSAPGTYTYTLLGTPPCVLASATVQVSEVVAPDAGNSATITLCSDEPAFDLVDRLGGDPDGGGSWVGPDGPHGGTFDPANDTPGAYVYTVAGVAPCGNATATLTIIVRQAPDAGGNASITVCSTDGSMSLFDELGGDPDAGGAWTGPDALPSPGTFIPGTSAVGVYTYTVTGLSPCAPASATVTVSQNEAPDAGVNASLSLCSIDAPVALVDELGGSPDDGGTWAGPDGPHGDLFTPGLDATGSYIYTVPGVAPCVAASAVVNVSVTQAPNAGVDGDTTVCSNFAFFDLIDLLGGAPDLTGTWTDPDGNTHSGLFTPGTDDPGIYRYLVPGQAPCEDDEAEVTVQVVEAPDPGINGSITLCSDTTPVDLFALLGGTPEAGGTWVQPGGGSHSGIYQPGTQPGGTFTYTLEGIAPCAASSSAVQVTRVIAPNAGANSSITVCSTNVAFQLLSVVGGDPNGNGSWLDPVAAPFPGLFTPGTSSPGTYTYVVPGNAPCANDTAQVSVVVNTAPNAGNNASITVCSADDAFDLVDALGGTPDGLGTWTAPDNSPSDGVYTPGSSLSGGYTYLVPGVTPCLSASAVLVVNENRQPVAGTSASFERCSTDGSVDLFTILDGTPDPGGSWSGPSGPSSGIFLPGSSPEGEYVYSISAVAPCVDASATVTATVNTAPDAGGSGGLSVCSDQSVVDLFDGLGGTPDANGTWSDDDGTGQQSGQFVNLIGLPAGDYDFTYTVPGIGQCGDASATVTVNIVGLLDAGTNGSISVCRSNAQFDLFTGLGGAPQPGGQWLDLDATGAITNQFFNASQVAPGTYQFRYRLTGTVSCASDSATTTVTVVAAPNAGSNNTINVCGIPPSTSLFSALGGNPSPGGVWTFNGDQFSGVYDPVVNSSGGYIYTVAGTAPCTSASATITVNEVPPPNAGTSATRTVCSNDGAFNMTNQLGGSPQPGNWSFNGQPHGSTFVPGLDDPGIYVYTVGGQSPCNAAQSTLTITQLPAPNAGNNASTTICSDTAPVVLFDLLGAAAQAGGSWVGPAGATNGVYIPGTNAPGDYFYTVTAQTPCLADVAVVSVFENAAPDAGINNAIALCSGGPNVNLITALGGSPDPTGTWTGPAPGNPPFSGVFVPGTTPAGVYTYTVTGAPPCSTVSSTVNVTISAQPSAGCSNAITICSNAAAFGMVDRLLCQPDLGGVWRGPAPSTAQVPGFFIPGQTPPGLYTYTVQGTAPCTPVSTTLNISVNPAANAGNDANLSVCSNNGASNLFDLLGPAAQVGGTWTNPDNEVHSGTFLPGVDQAGTYRYTVNGLSPCSSDFALVTVVVNQAAQAGCNGLRVICSSSDPFTLFSVLGCSPSSGGGWSDPSGAPSSGIYLPGESQPGVYTYTVGGQGACADVSAQVTIIENQAPDAGQNGFVSVCSDQAIVNLFNNLGGSPNTGGTWTAPDGSVSSGNFVPGTSLPGVYTYRLQALAPCVADSATITVSQNTAPSAGFSSVAFVCSDTLPFPLIDLLAGTPDLNGSWSFGGVGRSPVFNPAVDGTGTYVYTVNGIPPCSNALAQVQITRINAPQAGIGGNLAVCIDDPGISLFQGLSGSFSTGGTWTDDDGTGQLSGAVLDGTGLPPGSYAFTYTVSGASPCGAAFATVIVSITEALDAGSDATVTVCESEIIELFPLLGASALSGGVWQDVDGSSALLSAGVFNANLVDGGTTWQLRYVLGGSDQCPGDTALVTVSVLDGPYAGCDGSLTLCSDSPPVSMATVLDCGPDNTGSWIDPTGMAHGALFDPDLDVPGVYRYVVAGVGACPADTAQVSVQVTQAVNAGTSTSVSICSTDPASSLFPLLGPNAQTGGQWTYNNVPHSDIYNPAVDAPGAYIYTVQASSPCTNGTATVLVSEPQAPVAGSNAVIEVCTSEPPFNMRLSLGGGGVAQDGGTWVGPQGPHGPIFDPEVDPPGNYVYTVLGVAPCVDASATLAIAVFEEVNAGQNNTVAACVAQTELDLFEALGPLAQPGGTWTDVSSSNAITGDVFDPSEAGLGQWIFRYNIPSNGPCAGASSLVTVNVGLGSSAGRDTSVAVCGADEAYVLFDALAGDPTPGGSWNDLLGTGALSPEGLLNVNQLEPGSSAQFGYTVVDASCGTVSAIVTVDVSAFPDPGVDSELVLCVTDPPADLFEQLQGTPAISGNWTGPQGASHGSSFMPGTDAPGAYRYTVQGDGVCPDSSAVVLVVVDLPPDAGADGATLLCDTLAAFDLRGALGGSPQDGGTWSSTTWPNAISNDGAISTSQIPAGTYSFVYTVSNAGCGSASAQLDVELVGSIDVLDVQSLCNEEDRTYTVSFLIEDGDPGSYSVSGVEGAITSVAPYVYTSSPLFTSEGFEVFVSDGFACTLVRVIEQSPCAFDSEVFVPESFSPNDDGINDAFVIPGVEGFPGNSIVIFNRWGATMFEANGYDNQSMVWDGSSSDGSYSGIAPAGTYYYVLDLGTGSTPLTGYIYLNR